MAVVRLDEAERFYEEDEDPAEVFAEFDAAEKGRTMPQDERQRWMHAAMMIGLWMASKTASGLRHVADAIEPSRTRQR